MIHINASYLGTDLNWGPVPLGSLTHARWSIGAGFSNTTPDTVRYYTRIGLLRPGKDSGNDYKRYDEQQRKRLRFILCARQLGFSINNLAVILGHSERGDAACPHVAGLLQQGLDEAQLRLAHTASLNDELGKALKKWQAEPEQLPTGDMLRDLLENFADQ